MSMQEPDRPLDKTERERLEAHFVLPRIVELELDPVRGNFDAAHLREINRRLFQDLPDAGLSDVTPGEYRPPVPAGKDWYKNRGLSVAKDQSFFVAYSRMDQSAQDRLEHTLKAVNPEDLRNLKTAQFTAEISKLYVELDYIHPFSDGNSRTLRTFTRQLARESGYNLDWERFGSSEGGRDVLYIARDLSVNQRALPHLIDHGTRLAVSTSVAMLEGNRTLPDLLNDAVRPLRAIAFERLPEREALEKHPDLAEAYKTLNAATAYFKKELPGQVEAQQEARQTAKMKILGRLDAGEISNFIEPKRELYRAEQPKEPDR